MMLGLILSLIFSPLNSHSTEPDAGEILKTVVLNFNSEAVPEDRHFELRDRRLAGIVNWIQSNQPDLIFIAEGWNDREAPSVIQSIAKKTGYSYTYRLTMGVNGLLLDSNGVLLKPGHRFLGKHNFKLPHAALTLGDGLHWIISPGATSWGIGGKILTAKGNRVYAYATHLIGADQAKRSDQLVGLHRMIESEIEASGESVKDANILIAGDLNEGSSSPVLRNMEAIGYQDSFLSAHPEVRNLEALVCTFCSDPTTGNFNPMSIAPNLVPAQNIIEGDNRIDYILSHGEGLKPLSSTLVFTEPVNGVWMSDHFGVMSHFGLGDGGVREGTFLPNSYRDRTHDFKASRVIEITDSAAPFGSYSASSATGVTFINRTSRRVQIELEGKGPIWPVHSTSLAAGKVAAFFFEEGSHPMRFEVRPLLSPKSRSGQILFQ